MFCTNCGSKNKNSANFCRKCGQKLSFQPNTEGSNIEINTVESDRMDDIKENNLLDYYFIVFKKYVTFSGRARRKEYWSFFLLNIIAYFILAVIDALLGTSSESDSGILVTIYNLAIIIPSISVGVRRMHDVNKSGWWYLFPIYNFILTLREGTRGENYYGKDPKFE